MDDMIERLQRLDRTPSEVPPIDVASWVLSDLRAGSEPEPIRNSVLAALATAGSSAALMLGYLAYQSWSVLQDPLGPFLNSWSSVLP